MKKIVGIYCVLLLSLAPLRAQMLINEIMQSNIDCVMDNLNEFPDSWVELYNNGTASENLSAYSVGETVDPSLSYRLPSQTLNAKGFVLVYCDKENSGLHTDFRLETGKNCKFYLFKNDIVVDSLPAGMKKQPAPNIAFGRKKEGLDEWGYQKTPTPKAVNCGIVYDHTRVLGEPIFSVNGQVITGNGSLSVSITLPEGAPEGTEIRYTLNTYVEPTASSTKYTGPITISSATRIIRARLFCDGYLSPLSTTHSFIKFPRQQTLPVVSIVTKPAYFTDSKIGIYVDGTYSSSQKNYKYNWRRPINFELFETSDEESVLNQWCETRVTGGASRDASLKSLGLYANKRFGEKRFDYEFFPDQRPGLTRYKSVMLRNAGNDFDYLYMRDAVIQRIMAENVDMDWQAWRPVIFYLNGSYKGMLNIRERSNEANIYTNYDELEEIDMVENWNDLKEGRMSEWNAFKEFYTGQNHTYEEYDQIMDLNEFMNIMIMNLFFCNLDFPGNNIMFWKPQEEGGRWRVIAKDTDFGLGLYGRNADYRIFEWLYNPNYRDPYNNNAENNWANHSEHTLLFRRLMELDRFKTEFIDRCAIYIGDFMNFSRTWEIWSPMYQLIQTEYPNHRQLFNAWWPNYQSEMTNAKNWLSSRQTKFLNQVSSYYSAGTLKSLTINKGVANSDLERMGVTFNGVRLTRCKFDGKFFVGHSVTLTGENVIGWEITEITSTGSVNKREVSGNTYTFTMPNSSSYAVVAKPGDAQGIEICEDDNAGEIVEIYDETGRRLSKLQNGCNIIRTSDGTTKKIWY